MGTQGLRPKLLNRCGSYLQTITDLPDLARYHEPGWFRRSIALVLVLRFGSDGVWRDCCDQSHMGRRWGAERARSLSRRLQQLEAMTSLQDLGFMPFDSKKRPDGVIEIAVDDDIALFVEEIARQEEGTLNFTLLVSAVGARSVAVR